MIDIDKIKAGIELAQAQIMELGRQAMSEGLKGLFEEYPFLGAIAWAQYTPYFNDGEPCVFSTGEITCHTIADMASYEDGPEELFEDGPEFRTLAKSELWNYDAAGRGTYTTNPSFDPQYKACSTDAHKLFTVVPQDILQKMFGDHVTVVVNRDGSIDVAEYYHD